jgi:hypothetical protein
MSATPSHGLKLPDAKSEELADLDRPEAKVKRSLSKISIVSCAILVAMSTIGGAWMVVRFTIDPKAQSGSADSKRYSAAKKVIPIAKNRDEEIVAAATPAPIVEAKPEPKSPNQIPEEKQESGSLDRQFPTGESMSTPSNLEPANEPKVRAVMPSDHPFVESTPVPETPNSAEPQATAVELRPAEQVEPEPPESSPTDAVSTITGFRTLNRTRGTGLRTEIWDRPAEAHPLGKRSAGHSDYGVTERQLNEVYTKVRSGLGTSARQKLKVEELKWLREREAIGNNSDAFVAFTQDRIRVLNDMLPDSER